MRFRALLLIAAAFSAVAAHACSIPVFRYALDRWQADPFALEVSATDAKDEAVARFLRNLTDSSPLNLVPSRSQDKGPSRLAFPHAAADATPAWSGKLDGTTLPRLTDSPARAEVVKRILAGECAVWLLVESGQKNADDRATSALEKRLRYLEQVAQIPPIDPTDPTSQLGPGPALRVKFSMLRIRQNDPAEQPFIAMLAGPNHDMENANGPWLALVFGRGRVLGAWPAEGFGDEQTDEACLFLLGACSCQVKRMNPGWDLLLHADWNESLQAIGFPPPPPTAIQKPIVAAPEPEPVKPPTENAEATKPETVTIVAATPTEPAPRQSPQQSCLCLAARWRCAHSVASREETRRHPAPARRAARRPGVLSSAHGVASRRHGAHRVLRRRFEKTYRGRRAAIPARVGGRDSPAIRWHRHAAQSASGGKAGRSFHRSR
jgi:hypothetical protein